jgi:hypothetical protein
MVCQPALAWMELPTADTPLKLPLLFMPGRLFHVMFW